MKILHIGKLFAPNPGGIETFLLDFCRGAHARGISQGVLVHRGPHDAASTGFEMTEAAWPFLSYLDRVPVIAELGYAPISPQFPMRLQRALRHFQPDRLHIHLPNPSAFWLLLSRAARRLPWVIHWHADAAGPEYERTVRGLYPLYRPFEQAMLKHATKVVVTSPPYLQASAPLRAWHDKCVVVPLALDADRLMQTATDAAASLWQSPQRLRILALGRLTRYKGFNVLIEAAQRTQAELVIAGEGRERARLQAMIDERALSPRVRLLGGVSDAARNQLLRESDLLCLPSLNRAEAFGLSVLEAMALGKPALVSNLAGSGLPWLVEDGVTGWHVPTGDAKALAMHINGLDQDRDQIRLAGEAAAARYRNHFDFQCALTQLLDLHAQARR